MSVCKTCRHPEIVFWVWVECDCPLVFNVEVWTRDGDHPSQTRWVINRNKDKGKKKKSNLGSSEHTSLILWDQPPYATLFWKKKKDNTTFTDETRSGYWIFCTFWKVRTLWKSLACLCRSFMESRFPFQPREELLPPWWGENGSVSRPVLINTWIHEYGSGSHRRLMRCRVQSFGLGLFSLEWTGCSTLLNNNKTHNCLYRQKIHHRVILPHLFHFFKFIFKEIRWKIFVNNDTDNK